MNIYQKLLQQKSNRQKLLGILIDPDKITVKDVKKHLRHILRAGADYILVGGSFLSSNHFEKIVKKIKKNSPIPIIIFPGNTLQISKHADAIMFLSLISGRNPEYLIGKQVEAAPLIKKAGLESIATGYILIENGQTTTVQYITQTQPIPRNKIDLAVATAIAGELLGLKMIYLEAGSGARQSVPLNMIKAVKNNTNLPLIVGGGINSKKEVLKMWNAGADMVVIGTAIENNEFV